MPSALALPMAKVRGEGRALESCPSQGFSSQLVTVTAEVRQTIETSDDMLD